jgi:hypothetical protein
MNDRRPLLERIVNRRTFGSHALAAFGIIREEIPEMEFPDLPLVGFERLPR